ncbi:MAG: hypothetical protein ACJ71E_08335 [Nitrososphaeraceae archaeon]
MKDSASTTEIKIYSCICTISSGFSIKGSTTIVADGKFWRKMLYSNGNETITVSEEIGDAYPKDPIITICASNNTISKVIDGVK